MLCWQVNLADFTDNHWVTCFQDTAEQILGKKADELGELKEQVSQLVWDRFTGQLVTWPNWL